MLVSREALNGRVLSLALFLVLLSIPAYSADSFVQLLQRSNAGKALLSLDPRMLTDQVRVGLADGTYQPVADRTDEAGQVIDMLIRIKGRNPVLLGEAGVGKTAVAEKVAQLIVQKEIPTGRVYSAEIANAEIIQIQASALSGLAKRPNESARLLAQAIRQIESETKKSVILFVDEIHSADPEVWDALKTSMDASGNNGLRMIGATTEREFQLAFSSDDALMRRFAPIGVSEFSESMTVEIIKNSWQKVIERRYDVRLTDEVIEKVVKHYKKVTPDIARPDGPIKVLVDIAIQAHSQKRRDIRVSDIFSFIQRRTRLPADPQNIEEINNFIATKTRELKSRVLNQDHMIDQVMNRYRNLLLAAGDKPESAMFLGPTGIGKTFLAEELAVILYGGKHRFFKIDGAAFSDRSTALTGLLGPRPGTHGYKDTVGTLIEFMSNPGKGKYGGVLLIDEIDKMHPESLKELAMNLFDNGEVTSGKGKRVRASNLLILGATNHGVNQIFPDGYERWSETEILRRIQSFSQRDVKRLFAQHATADSNYKLPVELLNRIGVYVIGNPHSLDAAISIAKAGITERAATFQERNGIKIQVSDETVRYITEQVYSKEDGVRDLSRALDTFFGEVTAATSEKDISVNLVKSGAKRNWYFTLRTPKGAIELRNHSFKGSQNSLTAEDLRDLRSLTQRVSQRILGQDELISKSVTAIRNWLLVPNGKPLSIAVVGSTGTGKTETPKALALELFGSENKAQILALGEIRRVEDWTRVFGASPQYVKSDMMGLFEKAIIQIRDGGIMVLDEILNGKSKEVLEEGLLKFYNLSEEGFWVSPNTGNRYDLSKIIFWYNGNLLQEHYFGVSSDDMRMSIYEKLRPEPVVRQELRKAGVPEAFMGRLQVVVHAKPILDRDKVPISRNMLAKILTDIKAKYQGIDIKLPDSLIQVMSDSFFSSDQGGRSLRNKFESEIKGLITEAILEAGINEDNAAQKIIELRLIDRRSRRSYNIPNLKEEFYAQVLVFDKSSPSKAIATVTNNLLEKQDIGEKPNSAEFLKVSFHEIGHAVLNNPDTSGQRLRYVTIRPGSAGDSQKYLGYAAYDQLRQQNSGIKEMKENLVRIVGGRVAQEVAGYTADVGWSSDYQKMLKSIGKHYVSGGLKKELWGTQFNQDTGELIGTPEQKTVFAALVESEITEAMNTAKTRLEQSIGLVRFLVANLAKKMSLSGEEFVVLKKYYEGKTLSASEEQILKTRFNRSSTIRPAVRSNYNSLTCQQLLGGG